MSNKTCHDRARQYPPGALRTSDEQLFCATCDIPLDFSLKSRVDDHLQSQLHRDILCGRLASYTAQGILRRANQALQARDDSYLSSLAKAFYRADLPLTELENPVLVEHLSERVADLESPDAIEELKQCYQKYVSDPNREPVFCAVPTCETWCNSTEYTIFPFPESRKTQKLWRQALGPDQRSSKCNLYGVCELHFEPEFLVKNPENDRMLLMPGAVPISVTPGTPAPELVPPEPMPIAKPTPPAPPANVLSLQMCRMCGKKEKTLSVAIPVSNSLTEMLKDETLRLVLNMCLDLTICTQEHVCDACVSMVKFIGKFVATCKNNEKKILALNRGDKAYQSVDQEASVEQGNDTEEETDTTECSNETVTIKQEPLSYEVFEIVKTDPLNFEESVDDASTTEVVVKYETEAVTEESTEDTFSEAKRQKLEADHNTPSLGPEPETTTTLKYGCKVCFRRFETINVYNLHARMHNTKAVSSNNIQQHSHHQERPKQMFENIAVDFFKCLYCKFQCRSTQKLRAHCDEVHPEEKCDNCGRPYRNKVLLARHRATCTTREAT